MSVIEILDTYVRTTLDVGEVRTSLSKGGDVRVERDGHIHSSWTITICPRWISHCTTTSRVRFGQWGCTHMYDVQCGEYLCTFCDVVHTQTGICISSHSATTSLVTRLVSSSNSKFTIDKYFIRLVVKTPVSFSKLYTHLSSTTQHYTLWGEINVGTQHFQNSSVSKVCLEEWSHYRGRVCYRTPPRLEYTQGKSVCVFLYG